jgi:hypothetical protein
LKNILKFVWFATALFAFGLATISTKKAGFSESYPLFIIAGVALLMYFIRKKMSENEN